MKRLKFSIIALFAWFFIFYNVERIYEKVNLASFVYLLAPVLGLLVLGIPKLRCARVSWYVPLAFISVVALRFAMGYTSEANAFSLTITEGLATWITIALSYQLGTGIDEFYSAAATAMVAHLTERTRSFEEAQSDVIREVRRARLFRRPIAVLALNPKAKDDGEALDRFTHEFKSDLVQQYASARAAESLFERLRPCDILTQTSDQFLALLPEMRREEAAALAEEMQRKLRSELGIDLEVGLSMFPDDEVTLIGLIERAEAEVDTVRNIGARATGNLGRPTESKTHGAVNDGGAETDQEQESCV